MRLFFMAGTIAALLSALSAASAWADGGAVRTIERDGPFQISVFTSPHPLVAGPVDLSVLVQDAATLAPAAEVEIEVRITPREQPYAAVQQPATSHAATNKLYRSCLVELEPGWYDIVVACAGSAGKGKARVSIEVGPEPPPLALLWHWFAWPVVPVLLFGMHEFHAGRRHRVSAVS